jgi:hypothetical protein
MNNSLSCQFVELASKDCKKRSITRATATKRWIGEVDSETYSPARCRKGYELLNARTPRSEIKKDGGLGGNPQFSYQVHRNW